MHKVRVAHFAVVVLVLTAMTMAQQPPAAPFQTHQLTPNIYWVEGGGGNCGILVGDKGVVLVDSKTSPAGGKQLLDEVAKITSKPVTAVILTHSDVDHIGGLPAFPKGVTIIAHENDMKEQQAAITRGGQGAPSPDHLPTQIVSKDKESLTIDGIKLDLLHWAPAHTSGDLVVYLPSEKIVFTGDIVTNRFRPLIHLEKNGSSEGWISTVKGMLALDSNLYVAGHNGPVTKEALRKMLSDAEAERAMIKQMVAQGKTLPEIEAAVGDPPASEATGGNGPKFASFAEVVYRRLTTKTP